MNAKEFYLHLREADHRQPATPEELARPALGAGALSTNPFENVLGKLAEATRIIGELLQVIGKQVFESGDNPALKLEYNRRLTDLGITSDDLPESLVAITDGAFTEGSAAGSTGRPSRRVGRDAASETQG
jgi:hypothetical protein